MTIYPNDAESKYVNPDIYNIKYINPDIYNEYKNNLNLDFIKDYISKKKFYKINCHSFQIVYRVNSSIYFLSF